MEKKLYRNEHGKMIGGVCAGLADYFGVDPTVVRLIFLATLVFGHGSGLIAYIILLIALPKRNVFAGPNFNPGVDYRVPPSQPFGTPFTQPAGEPFSFGPVPPKKASNAGVICGAILIVLGTIFLVDNLDIIPDWDFDRLWPIVIIAAGAAIILAGKKKQPWERADWNAATTTVTEEPVNDSNIADKTSIDLTKKNNEPSNDNPTTI